MTHLTPDELVDLVDGSLSRERAAHADTCDACRREAIAMQQLVAEVRGVEIPEPSPLFWKHFSARVHARAAAEVPRSLLSLRWRPVVAAAAAVVAVLVLAGEVWRRGAWSPSPGVPEVAGVDAGAVTDDSAEPTLIEDAWEVLSLWLADLGGDDAEQAAAVAVAPGTAERALAMLTDGERAELVRLLKQEVPGGVR